MTLHFSYHLIRSWKKIKPKIIVQSSIQVHKNNCKIKCRHERDRKDFLKRKASNQKNDIQQSNPEYESEKKTQEKIRLTLGALSPISTLPPSFFPGSLEH